MGAMRGWGVGLAVAATVACGAPAGEDAETTGAFVTSADDEAIDPSDPPTDPDPADDPIVLGVETRGAGSGGARCKPRSATLSPKGLTFVLHVSRHADKAEKELDHLKKIARYLRARDIFMVERTSPVLGRLHDLFPCNAFHFIAYPDEFDDALKTGGLVDGIAIDWEGSQVDGNSQAFSIDRLADYARRIRKDGRQPGFVPAWAPRFEDATVTKRSGMDYELAQIQPACVNSPSAFAHRARALLHDFRAEGVGLRNVGFEISLDSFQSAENHVEAPRAADCTRAGYGKGARAIYIYGNGSDNLVDYFHALGRMGVRAPR